MAVRWRLLVVAAAVVLAIAAGAVRRARTDGAILRADPETILGQSALASRALALGQAGFARQCASCHGSGRGDPMRGVPDLTDGDFLYGSGEVAEIEQIVLHGIRSGDSRGWHLAAMPAYARATPYPAEPAIKPLTPSEIGDVAQHLSRERATDAAAAARGAAIFAGRGACWDCHGPDGGGNPAIGAPNLNDRINLYGDGSMAALTATLARGRAGISPAFGRTVSPLEARAIAVYVASLARKSV